MCIFNEKSKSLHDHGEAKILAHGTRDYPQQAYSQNPRTKSPAPRTRSWHNTEGERSSLGLGGSDCAVERSHTHTRCRVLPSVPCRRRRNCCQCLPSLSNILHPPSSFIFHTPCAPFPLPCLAMPRGESEDCKSSSSLGTNFNQGFIFDAVFLTK